MEHDHSAFEKGQKINIRNKERSIKGEITQKALKRELSFLYATHRHDLFYKIVKYHHYSSYRADTKCLRKNGRRIDARFIAISPENFGRG